jgi:hypothetical protein
VGIGIELMCAELIRANDPAQDSNFTVEFFATTRKLDQSNFSSQPAVNSLRALH